MKKTVIKILAVLLIVAVCSADGWAQRIFTYPVDKPVLTGTPAINGSSVKISLRGAPSNALVWWSFSLLDESSDAPLDLEGFDQDPAEANNGTWDESSGNWDGGIWAEVATADQQGRAHFEIPLENPDWSGRAIRVQALIRDPAAPENTTLVPFLFTVQNPELHLPSFVTQGSGTISKYDEVQRDLIAQVQGLYGIPEKIVVSRDARKGFVMLDGDRIAVIDNQANRLDFPLRTGHGLVDIAVTPDGKKLIALTRGVNDPSMNGLQPGRLWIYDTEDLGAPELVSIDPVQPGRKGNLLFVSDDSTLVLIRQAGLFVGTYNLLLGQYQPILLGEKHRHHRGEILDLNVYGNCLLALITHPDGTSYLLGVNLQNYGHFFSFEVGSSLNAQGGANRIRLLERPGRHPRVALIDQADASEDRLQVIDIFTDIDHASLTLPDGVVDFDALETSGICMILYRNEAEGKGIVRFVDLIGMKLIDQVVTIDLASSARVYISRSENLHSGYIYSTDGILFHIDLDRFTMVEQIRLPGGCSGSALEIY